MRARAALHRRDGRGPAARAGSRPRRRRRQVMKRIVGMSAVMANGDGALRGGTDAKGNPYTYPLVAQRDSILRVYVTPESGFSTHALTARARIVTATPTGTQAQVFSATGTISTPSQQFDLGSTINIPIPGLALERGSRIT